MKRTCLLLSLMAVSLLSTGCAMCCAPYDYAYPAYGGLEQYRVEGDNRAGSAFGGSTIVVQQPTEQVMVSPNATYANVNGQRVLIVPSTAGVPTPAVRQQPGY